MTGTRKGEGRGFELLLRNLTTRCWVLVLQSLPFVLRNDSLQLPLTFATQRVAHLRLHPHSGFLLPGASVTVDATFRPRHCGKMAATVALALADSTVVVPVKVGTCVSVSFSRYAVLSLCTR